MAIPVGHSNRNVTVPWGTLPVYTYKPSHADPEQWGFLFVCHGTNSDANNYVNHGVPLADYLGVTVIAPEWPNVTMLYQHGGICDNNWDPLPQSQWTITSLPQLATWARTEDGVPDAPWAAIGHSAGGQFLSMAAAFYPFEEDNRPYRLVMANPSKHVLPYTGDFYTDGPGHEYVPYGMGLFYDTPQQEEAALRRYLSCQVSFLNGANDNFDNGNMDTSEEAMRQGPHRLARAQNVYAIGQSVAASLETHFEWRGLYIVPDVGHSASQMFRSYEAVRALGYDLVRRKYYVPAASGFTVRAQRSDGLVLGEAQIP